MPANAIQLSLLINLPDELQDNHTSSTDVEENATELTVQNRLCHLQRSKPFSAGKLGIFTLLVLDLGPRTWSNTTFKHTHQFLCTKPLAQSPRTAQGGRGTKRSCEPTSSGKGLLDKSIQHPVQPGKSYKIPGRGPYHVPGEALPVIDYSFIKIKLFPLQHPFGPRLWHEKYQLNNHLEGAQMQRRFQVIWWGVLFKILFKQN